MKIKKIRNINENNVQLIFFFYLFYMNAIFIGGNLRVSERAISSQIKLLKSGKFKLFIFTESNIDKILDHYSSVKEHILIQQYDEQSDIEKEKIFKKTFNSKIYKYPMFCWAEQLYKNFKCKQMILEYEKNNHFEFDNIIKIRFESIIMKFDDTFCDISSNSLYGDSDAYLLGKRDAMIKYAETINSKHFEQYHNTGKMRIDIDSFLLSSGPRIDFFHLPYNENIDGNDIEKYKIFLRENRITTFNKAIWKQGIVDRFKFTAETMFPYHANNEKIILCAIPKQFLFSIGLECFVFLDCKYIEKHITENYAKCCIYNFKVDNFIKTCLFKDKCTIQIRYQKYSDWTDEKIIDYVEHNFGIKIIEYVYGKIGGRPII